MLGKETAKFLAKAFLDGFTKWAKMDTLKRFYENPDDLSVDYSVDGRSIRFVFVIHPSLNGTNRSIVWGKELAKNREQTLLQAGINTNK